MTPTTIAAIIGAALSVGIAVIGAISGIKKKREEERRAAELRQKEHEARLKSIERMFSNGNANTNMANAYPQHFAQPTTYCASTSQPTTITVNHYLHGSQAYTQPTQPVQYAQQRQTIPSQPTPQSMNYGYGYGGGYNEPVWPAERIYGRGGGYNTPLEYNSNYAYAYA